MVRTTSLGAILLAGSAQAAEPLSGVLNFRNVTGQRVVMTVEESANNEKEVEFGDFDQDNDLDVVIANAYSDFGQRRNKLYRNDGGIFLEVSGSPIISGFSGTDVSRNAFFRDYDLDGWLDIIIVNDNNTAGDPGRTKIYMNQHSAGQFTDYVEDGLARLGSGTGGAACGGYSFDADMDGDQDLYVGNYPGPSQDTMYFNNAVQNPGNPGFFTEVTGTNLPVDSDYTVDVATADVNGDGKLDLLVSNSFSDPNFIYYNDNLNAGTSVGDFSYTGSTQVLSGGTSENAMEAGDFDGDGDQDIYWTNQSGSADRIFENVGNDGSNKAMFQSFSNLPAAVTGFTSRKATVADLNEDGRLDIFVMRSGSRPVVLRNVTVNNTMEFVDWTPASAFPTGNAHEGWHAAAFDADGDDDLDIFLGGWTGDHLFHNSPPSQWHEDDLGGTIPNVFNASATVVIGAAGLAQADTFTIEGLISSAHLAVVLRGADDYLLEILDGASVLATVNRGAEGVEEAVQFDPSTMPASVDVRVTVLACGNPFNVSGDCAVDTIDFLDLLAAWGPNSGHPADFDANDVVDTVDFLALLAAWGTSEYILEVLARNG